MAATGTQVTSSMPMLVANSRYSSAMSANREPRLVEADQVHLVDRQRDPADAKQ
jgi:hypothetical protein